MKKSFFKRGASALLAVVMCLSTFLGIGSTTAFAAENTTDEVVMFSFPREGDSNFGGDWGHGELKYMNGWSAASTKKITVYTIGSWTGNACYCIEPGTPLNIGDVMTKRDENYWDNYPSAYNKTISADEIKLFIGRIFQYGYTGKVDIDWRSQNSADADKMAHIMATQTLIWETVVGERDSNFNHVDTGSYDAINDRVSKNHPLYSQYMSYYNSMVSNVQKHSKVPSFFAKSTSKAQDIELEWNGTNYSTTLTDTNNVLGNYSFTASESGISFSASGNKLTITANKAPTSKVSITATKNGSVRKGVVVWSDGVYAPGNGQQDLSTFAAEVNDPVRGYLNIKVSLGSAKIVKTSEDGNVSGISFTITGNGVNKTVKTGSNGEIVIDNLSPGTYTVTEQSIGYYEPQQSKTVTVVSGQTASVSFKNVLKRSDLKVIKTSEDNMNEGVKFHLYGKSTSGQTVDLFATTDKNGVAMFKNVLVGTNYTLEEVETAERYIIPDSQVAVIEWEKVTENDFYNELKRGDLKVVKTSEDNMVEGIKFHLYGTSLSGHKVDEYAVTDKNGVAMFEDVLIGSRYTLEEVNTAEKYIVPKAQTVEIEWNKVPAEEIKFIHEADTEAKKLELFKKVRRGDVRILMGSTQKMGAGTNVQNKLSASSDLDCPWRPSDLEQRLGRSIRQGNENPEVDIFRFVTEETFDAYLYQLVEGKQKFASQIMTSKSPVRSCEDMVQERLTPSEPSLRSLWRCSFLSVFRIFSTNTAFRLILSCRWLFSFGRQTKELPAEKSERKLFLCTYLAVGFVFLPNIPDLHRF